MIAKMRNFYFLLLIVLAITSCKEKFVYVDQIDLSTCVSGWNEAKPRMGVEGKALRINGTEYKNGFGTHAISEFKIKLNGSAIRFTAIVGLDDEAGKYSKTGATVDFKVFGDSVLLFESGNMKFGDSAKSIDISLKDYQVLLLFVGDAGDGSHGDHANWADARIYYKGSTEPIALNSTKLVEPYILTPKPSDEPRINGPRVSGVRPGNDFLYRIPATGIRPMTFATIDLPKGLVIDPVTGVIQGKISKRGVYPVILIATNAKGSDSSKFEIRVGDTIALTPPMGWNSWNVFGLSITEEKVKAVADAFESTGLVNYGWQYINIDDGWEDSIRDSKNVLQVNSKFKSIKNLSDYLHQKGLKLGIYSSPGPKTCGNFLGSYKFEGIDAQTYGEWGVDYLKYDWCSYGEIALDNSLAELQKPYIIMRKELDKVNRDIVYSLCQYGMGNVWEWGEQIGGNCWRTTGDIVDTWGSVYNLLMMQKGLEKYAKPGHWNDPDMLVIGWVGWGENLHQTRLNANEQYLHVSLWSMLASPLLLGCDITKLDAFTLSLITNSEIIDINQDQLGNQASIVYAKDFLYYYKKKLHNGSVAIAAANMGFEDASANIDSKITGMEGTRNYRNAWKQEDVAFSDTYEVNVPAHGCVVLVVK